MNRTKNLWNVGTNWSGFRELSCLENVLNNVQVDFVEILIDNFLTVDPILIKNFLSGKKCAFHIMNSQFLHRGEVELQVIVNKINQFSDILDPLYISDHLGIFYIGDLPLISMEEVDYSNEEFLFSKIQSYQKMIGSTLLVENYPSIFCRGKDQIKFFQKLISNTNLNMLFDISNASVAENNKVINSRHWKHLLSRINHFHIAGYEWSSTTPSLCIDTHATQIDQSALTFLSEIKNSFNSQSRKTISVERDDNFILQEWCDEIKTIRKILNND